MQTTSLTRAIGGGVGAALFTIGLLAVVPYTGAAQDQPQTQGVEGRQGGHGPDGFGGRAGRMGGPMRGPMGGGFAGVMRDLTTAQRDQVKAIHERHAERLRPLMDRTHATREALNEAVLKGTGDLQSLSIEVGNAETELAFAQAQVQSEILGVLTAEQKQKIAERRTQMEQRRAEMMKRRQVRQVR